MTAPIKVGLGFSLLTYGFFVFGVWDFPDRHSIQLAAWVLFFNLAMLTGFMMGIRKRVIVPPPSNAEKTLRLINRLVQIAFYVTLATFVPRFLISTQLYALEFDRLLGRIQIGLNDPLSAYQTRSSVRPPGVWVYINYLCVATGFIAWLYTPLAVLFWKRLSVFRRLFTVIFWASVVVSAIARGQNFGAFDLGIQIVVFIIARKFLLPQPGPEVAADARKPSATGSRRLGVRNIIALIGPALVMVWFFANTMRSRVGDRFDHLISYGGRYVAIDRHSPMWILCPDSLKPISATLLGYVSHGYMGLELSLRMSFNSALGLGSSFFLIDNAQQMFGANLLPLTYQFKVYHATGYHYSALWHTAYTWIANDVSFWGVPVVLFYLLFIFGSAWHDFVLSRNLFGALLMGPMATLFAFISANNQVMSNPNSLGAMIFLTLVWSATRNRFDWEGALGLLQAHQSVVR